MRGATESPRTAQPSRQYHRSDMARTTTPEMGGMQEIRVPDDNTADTMRSAARARDSVYCPGAEGADEEL
ncbi:hypothetical protein GCM10015535_14280 [Streptomyces gelaticus]|uniref:Uncharacterized protein n=1 Tax=Streptomyces gelaticus TaxID=285446 RepID=A0ABQ2VWK7_9ACTN|nr:hypothetical protein GCM10015535_14280 [Streptomyces gelaticus]